MRSFVPDFWLNEPDITGIGDDVGTKLRWLHRFVGANWTKLVQLPTRRELVSWLNRSLHTQFGQGIRSIYVREIATSIRHRRDAEYQTVHRQWQIIDTAGIRRRQRGDVVRPEVTHTPPDWGTVHIEHCRCPRALWMDTVNEAWRWLWMNGNRKQSVDVSLEKMQTALETIFHRRKLTGRTARKLIELWMAHKPLDRQEAHALLDATFKHLPKGEQATRMASRKAAASTELRAIAIEC